MTFKQGGIIMPHLLHHGASVFEVSSEGPPYLNHLKQGILRIYSDPDSHRISVRMCLKNCLYTLYFKKNIFYRNVLPWIPVLYTSLDKYPPQVSSGTAGQGWLHFAPSVPCLPKAFPHQHSLPYCRPAYLKPNEENKTHKNSLSTI